MFDSLFINARLATLTGDKGYGLIENGALGITGGKIAFVGRMGELPKPAQDAARIVYDLNNKFITPGLIDCHTHLVYAGNRANEFALRLKGASYEDIAKIGGGIVSTVTATRAASEDELFESALRRLQSLMREGVTGVEIKSGYGLNLEAERKMLKVATRLRNELSFRVQRTFLGAHAVPPEYKGRQGDYIDYICAEMLPVLVAEGLVDAVDAFGENIGFTPDEVTKVFETAKRLKLPVKLHADQLSNQGGGALAAKYRALSADHIEHLDDAGITAMAAAGTVAVLLPGAFYYLRETKVPPIEKLRAAKIPIALATDCNPGTSPITSVLLILNMAATLFRLNPEEALRGITINAARALGFQNICGSLKAELSADLAIFDVGSLDELTYQIGLNPCAGIVLAGEYFSFAE